MAVRATVQSLRMHNDAGLGVALQREADSQAIAYTQEDLKHGLAAVMSHGTATFPDVKT